MDLVMKIITNRIQKVINKKKNSQNRINFSVKKFLIHHVQDKKPFMNNHNRKIIKKLPKYNRNKLIIIIK